MIIRDEARHKGTFSGELNFEVLFCFVLLFGFLFVCLFVGLFVCLSVCLFFFCFFVCFCFCVFCLFVCLFICLFVCFWFNVLELFQLENDTWFIKINQGIRIEKESKILIVFSLLPECFHLYLRKSTTAEAPLLAASHLRWCQYHHHPVNLFIFIRYNSFVDYRISTWLMISFWPPCMQ